MMLEKLPSDQQDYLISRGFEIVQGLPKDQEPYPYFVLHPLRKDRPSMEYVHGQFSHANFGFHPATTDSVSLVQIIAGIVGRHKQYDGDFFTTMPGVPIKVFQEDSSWDDIGKLLRGYSDFWRLCHRCE
jgi:hypothetical protein